LIRRVGDAVKDIIFGIENRWLLKYGWQACIGKALTSFGHHPGVIPQGAKMAHKPIPNQAKTLFHIFVLPEGAEIPFEEGVKVRDFYEFMSAQPLTKPRHEYEHLIEKHIQEHGPVIH